MNNIYLGVLTNNNTDCNTDFISLLASNLTDEMHYYESNDVKYISNHNFEMISSLPFIGIKDTLTEYKSGKTNTSYKKMTEFCMFATFVKDFIRPIAFTLNDNNKCINIICDCTPEEFISFKNKLLNLYSDTKIVEMYHISKNYNVNPPTKVEVLKEIFKDEINAIKNMRFIPYFIMEDYLIRNKYLLAKFDRNNVNKTIVQQLEDNKHNFFMLNYIKINIMKLAKSHF